VLTWRSHSHQTTPPTTDAPWPEAAAREAASPAAFADVITRHLEALRLPFKPRWLEGTWQQKIDYEPP
jgi:hypothetical protein